MNTDLAESIAVLKDVFARRAIPARFGKAQPEVVEQLREKWSMPARYGEFLRAADPVDVETVTPTERVRLIPSDKLPAEQPDAKTEGGFTAPGWSKTWIVIARSALNGDPYFVDTAELDAEGDCPVFTCSLGTDVLKPELCASSIPLFLQILARSMEVASGFGDSGLDDEDAAIFREALAPRIKSIDPDALRAGHWT